MKSFKPIWNGRTLMSPGRALWLERTKMRVWSYSWSHQSGRIPNCFLNQAILAEW